MIEICFSETELNILVLALQEREDRMYRDSEEYKKQDNKIAQMDCLSELKMARELRRRLEEIG
jgi:hypothetical protein